MDSHRRVRHSARQVQVRPQEYNRLRLEIYWPPKPLAERLACRRDSYRGSWQVRQVTRHSREFPSLRNFNRRVDLRHNEQRISNYKLRYKEPLLVRQESLLVSKVLLPSWLPNGLVQMLHRGLRPSSYKP
tara:strand:+ start:44 stop:433 length:390 start_codon:yes stop_codon:yes gene_type:complete